MQLHHAQGSLILFQSTMQSVYRLNMVFLADWAFKIASSKVVASKECSFCSCLVFVSFIDQIIIIRK